MRKLEFLKVIYKKQCSLGDWVVLSVKGPDVKWRDVPIKYTKNFDKELNDFFKKYPDSKYDLYFSPMSYNGPNRRIVNLNETKYLFADLDEKTTKELKSIKSKEYAPRYLWESSPGKYQCIVEMDRYVGPTTAEKLNKGLEDYYGADNCGDLPHVIRIPGTTNHKYKDKPKVKKAESMGKPYRPALMMKTLSKPEKKKPTELKIKDYTQTERQIYAKYNIPHKTRELLALQDLGGLDRSKLLWSVESQLIEIGMEPKEILVLIKNSVFNKYKDRKDGDKRLEQELRKIIDKNIIEPIVEKGSKEKLKMTSYDKLMLNNKGFGGWLVKGFWGRRSHGIVAGMPKSFKSTLVHDLAVSVASGKPFLGKYEVEEPGPVIIVQNENADHIMKDRTNKIICQKGLGGSVRPNRDGTFKIRFGEDLPIHMINQQGFLLTNESHKEQLVEMIKEVKPVLIVLDPLYLMFDGDLNAAGELNPVLNWLLKVKNDHQTSVMLVHHYNKGSGDKSAKGGTRMSGSIFLYGWVESAWYLCREDENDSFEDSDDQSQSLKPSKVSLKREFRFAGHFGDVLINLTMGGDGSGLYDVRTCKFVEGQEHITILEEVMTTIRVSADAGVSLTKLSRLGISEDYLHMILSYLVDDKVLDFNRKKGLYYIHKKM